jgi:tRNA (cytidine56-2'-O)-methyltransferase
MVSILRIGHRRFRDSRISTHCGLVARAFGADEIIYTGEKDEKLMDSVRNVAEKWGGSFDVSYEKSWRKVIKKVDGKTAHLTMYGLPVQKEIAKIRKSKQLMVIVGGEKVPSELYGLADYNIAVTSQPHSEIAALGVFLDRYFEGKELNKSFKGGLEIVPQKSGKRILGK